MPHILHVFKHYALFSKGGGVERYIHQLALKTMQAGNRVSVYSEVGDDTLATLPYRTATGNILGLWRAMRGVDTVHLHGPRVAFSAIAGLCAWVQGKRIIYTVHCFYEGKTPLQSLKKNVWDRTVEAALVRVSDATIFLSPYWLNHANERGLNTSHPLILPNGIDVQALQQEVSEPLTLAGAPAILSVSRLDPIKRVDDIIRALREPALAHAHLHVVGRGDDEPRLVALVADHGLTERVTFHHFKSDAEVASMARAADVFVIASAEEGMPTTILEMLARGVPVVASQIPGNLSIMEQLDCPTTYPLGNVTAMAEQIILATHTPLGPQVVTALYQYFDWGSISALLQPHYVAAAQNMTNDATFLGVRLDRLSPDEILAAAREALPQKLTNVLEGLNVAKLVQARRDPSLMQALNAADIVHVDGAGIALGAKLLGLRLPPRRAGIDLMMDLLRLCAEMQHSVYLLGATEESLNAAMIAFKRLIPGLIIAGSRNGYFTDAEEPAIVAAICASGAGLLLLGISSPKKEQFLHRHRDALKVGVAMGVGGAFDVISGKVARAPMWMQRMGLEWSFRLIQEPKRLLWRYVDTNTVYGWLLLKALITGTPHASR